MRRDLRSLWDHSGAVFGSDTPRRTLQRLRFVLAARRLGEPFWAEWRQPGSASLRQQLERDPRLAGFVVWPYLNRRLQPEHRIRMLAAHWQWQCRQAPWAPHGPVDSPLLLVDMGARLEGLGLYLEHAPWFVREGGLNLSLMLSGERLITLAFSMAAGPEGLTAYIGSLQGSNRPDVIQTYKAVAEAANDLRPRDLLVKAFRLLAEVLGCREIACVADESHVQNHPYFGGQKSQQVLMRYDDLWEDLGAVRGDDGYFRMPASALTPRESG